MNLEKILMSQAKQQTESKPIFFDMSNSTHRDKLATLLDDKKINHTVDDYSEQLKEYFHILNPRIQNPNILEKKFRTFLKTISRKNPMLKQGKWVYFPWRSALVHILPEHPFFMVRTARNRNLITSYEQKQFYNSTVGIAGLSVGNSAALALVLQGGARHIKLADYDKLALSNTNRIRTSLTNLGLPKVEMTAREIYELNPYAKVEIFPDGLNQKNIALFCRNLDVVVDEIDNLAIKFKLRIVAKKRKLPVVMGADNGDSSIIDIERYDKDSKLPLFHGRLGKISLATLGKLDKIGTGKMIVKHLDPQNINDATWQSFLQIGKTLVSWPQLGGTALVNGAAICYCLRKILSEEPLENSRAIISFEEKFLPDYASKNTVLQKKITTEKIKNSLGL